MTYKPQPADPLDLAIAFSTLALALCPDQVRQAMIAILDQQITPLDEQRFDQLLQQIDDLDAACTGSPPWLPSDLDIPPAIARWLRATRGDHYTPPTNLCLPPTEPLLLTPGAPQHGTG